MAVGEEEPLPPTKGHLIMIEHNCARTKLRVACLCILRAGGVEGLASLWKEAFKVVAWGFLHRKDRGEARWAVVASSTIVNKVFSPFSEKAAAVGLVHPLFEHDLEAVWKKKGGGNYLNCIKMEH